MIFESSPQSVQRIWGTLCQFNALWINSLTLPPWSLHWSSCHATTFGGHHLAHLLIQWALDQVYGGTKAHPAKLMPFGFSPQGTPCQFKDRRIKYFKVPFWFLHWSSHHPPIHQNPLDPLLVLGCPVLDSQVLRIQEWSRHLLQLVHCAYLLTRSKYFKLSWILEFRVNSEVSLYGGEHSVSVKLVVWCLGVSIQIDSTDGMGGRGIK